MASSGYLLDNNIISILVRPADPIHAAVKARFQKLGDAPVFLPVVAIAEIEAGMAKANTPDETQRADVRRFFNEYPLHLAIDDNTVEPYALIRARLWRDFATPKTSGRGHKERLPEELLARDTGKSLGIDERDLLIAATAAQYRLVLITNDANEGMRRIEESAQRLELEGQPVHLRVERWR